MRFIFAGTHTSTDNVPKSALKQEIIATDGAACVERRAAGLGVDVPSPALGAYEGEITAW